MDIADVRLDIITFEKNDIKISYNVGQRTVIDKLCNLYGNFHIFRKPLDFSDNELKDLLNLFIDEVLKIYKPEQIILNNCQCVNDYISKKNNIVLFKWQDYIKKSNVVMRKAFQIISNRLPQAHCIPFPENVISNANHKWGLSCLHYDMLYYEYGKKAFDIIASVPENEQEALKELMDTYSEKFLELRKRCSECSISEIKRGGYKLYSLRWEKLSLSH